MSLAKNLAFIVMHILIHLTILLTAPLSHAGGIIAVSFEDLARVLTLSLGKTHSPDVAAAYRGSRLVESSHAIQIRPSEAHGLIIEEAARAPIVATELKNASRTKTVVFALRPAAKGRLEVFTQVRLERTFDEFKQIDLELRRQEYKSGDLDSAKIPRANDLVLPHDAVMIRGPMVNWGQGVLQSTHDMEAIRKLGLDLGIIDDGPIFKTRPFSILAADKRGGANLINVFQINAETLELTDAKSLRRLAEELVR